MNDGVILAATSPLEVCVDAILWAQRVFDQTVIAGAMRDPRVTEVMINGPDRVFVEISGVKKESELTFGGLEPLMWLIERLLELNPTQRLDAARPFADLSLPDGSRVNIVIPPVTVAGPHVTIRKYAHTIDSLDDMVALGSMDDRLANFLDASVAARLNVLFSGAAGSGKTTLLEVLSCSFDPSERIVVIEDTAELRLRQPDVVHLLTRPSNLEGKGAITFDQLFRNSLRMRPDRILLGELRGAEVMSWLQAVNSGHRGSMAVLHASTPAEALLRIEGMMASAGLPLARDVIQQQVGHGVDLVVQVAQYPDGVRRVSEVSEVIAAPPGYPPQLQSLFQFVPEHRRPGERIFGRFRSTGAVPSCLARFQLAGVELDGRWFVDEMHAA